MFSSFFGAFFVSCLLANRRLVFWMRFCDGNFIVTGCPGECAKTKILVDALSRSNQGGRNR